jgi:hypothetical protein
VGESALFKGLFENPLEQESFLPPVEPGGGGSRFIFRRGDFAVKVGAFVVRFLQ